MRKPARKPFNKEELLKELKQEFERLGSTRLKVYDEKRRDHLPSSYRVRARLGNISWSEVVALCGYEPYKEFWPKEKIIEVIKKQNKKLSFYELENLGIPRSTVFRIFGSYANLYRALGWDYESKEFFKDVTDEELIKEYDNICRMLGKTATTNDIKEHSKYPFEVFRSRFGTINELRRRAGYEYYIDPRTITKEQCMNEMLNIYEKHGKISYGQLEKILPFNLRTLLRKFGTTSIKDVWKEVIEEFERRKANERDR